MAYRRASDWDAHGRTRHIDANGYARVYVDGEFEYEHRVVWTETHGPIPDGHHVHHVNHVRDDNRPENLRLIDGREHNRRHTAARHRSGTLDNRLSLSGKWREDVDGAYIVRRKREGASYRQIGRELGCDHHVVKRHFIAATTEGAGT